MKNVLARAGALAALALLTNCTRVIRIDSGYSAYASSDLKATTNLALRGGIPAEVTALEVENQAGAIRLTGTEIGPHEWSWTLAVRAIDDQRAQEAAEAARCTAHRDGERLRLVVSLPSSHGDRSFQSDLEIRVPKTVAVKTRNRFGRTEISDLRADTEATAANGVVEVRRIDGKVRAETSFATLTVESSGAARLANQSGRIEAAGIHGPLEAETSFAALEARNIGGSVELRNQSGRLEIVGADGDADLRTSFAPLVAKGISGNATMLNQSGSVEASDIAGSVKATTSFAAMDISGAGPSFFCRNQSGAIRLRASSASLTKIEAQTSFSLIEVRLPSGLKPAIQARTTFAEIESDFPVLMPPRGKEPFAEVQPGTPLIRLENQSGPIRVVRD